VFNKLKELGEWKLPNPLEEVEPFYDEWGKHFGIT
jgi:hypothetical protein